MAGTNQHSGYPSHDLAPGRFTLEWWFDTTAGATATPTTLEAFGIGVASIIKTAAGTYVITLEDNWVKCVGAGAAMANAPGTFSYAQCSKPDVGAQASTKQFTVQTIAAAGGAVIDPVGTRVFVSLVLVASTARGA